MSSDWYIQDKGKSLFGGLESEFNNELDTVFREMALAADNGYDVVASRPTALSVPTRAIVQSSTQSKHGEKIILFEKGIILIGDIVTYGSNKYLISSWVNEDISMNDSAPMHLCNANMTYKKVTKTPVGGNDPLGRPEYNETVVDTTVPCVFDTARYSSDEGGVVNLENDVVECWVQYTTDLIHAINTEVDIHGKYYTIDGISRDLIIEGATLAVSYGVIRLRLRVKE